MIAATIVFNDGRTRVQCIIRNLSDGGAKLEVRGSVAGIPQTFDLMAPGYSTHGCRVIWRALKELGVAFTN